MGAVINTLIGRVRDTNPAANNGTGTEGGTGEEMNRTGGCGCVLSTNIYQS